MNKKDYTYCFLRYRQDPEAGEFANIGVALWSPSARFLGFQGSPRYGRLTHFFSNIDREGYRLVMSYVERRFSDLHERIQGELPISIHKPESVLEIAKQVVPQDDGSLIWSSPRGGITDDPCAELTRIFKRFVGRYNEPEEKARRDESQVFRQVYRKAFLNEKIISKIQQHQIVAPLASHIFQYAWKNGVWNVYETLSFDLLDADSIERKAHTWYGRSVHLSESPDRPKLHFLLGQPSLTSHVKKYGQAKEILRSAKGVELIEEDQADSFALSLEKQIEKSE